jgi:hypothetical protein
MQDDALRLIVDPQRNAAVGSSFRDTETQNLRREALPCREIAHFEPEVSQS